MNITTYSTFTPKDIKYLSPYASIYLCMKKVNMQDIKGTKISKDLYGILKSIKKVEAKNLYLIELQKINEYLHHNKIAEELYYVENMLVVKLSTGIMCKTTVQMLVDNDGLSYSELDEFSKLLHFRISEDIELLYDEIERNLDGRYGVKYDRLY